MRKYTDKTSNVLNKHAEKCDFSCFSYHLFYKQLRFARKNKYGKCEKYVIKNLHTFNICHTFAVTKTKTKNAQ